MVKKETSRERLLIKKFQEAEAHRKWKETEWMEQNYAYQMITDTYSGRRMAGEDPLMALDYLESDSALSQINLPVEFSVIIRKTAEEMRNLPNFKWISMSKDNTEAKGKLFSSLFDWVWYEANGDVEIFKVLLAKNIYGDSFAWVFHEDREIDCKVPYVDKDEVKFRADKRRISRTRFLQLDIRDFYPDPGATTIEDSEYAFIAVYLTEDKAKALLDKYVKKTKYKWGDFSKSTQKKRSLQNVGESQENSVAEYYFVRHYYNQVTDEYVIMIDDKIIHDSYIPSAPDDGVKRIPVAHFKDHHLDGEFYGAGESRIVKPHREVKNNLVNLTFDVSRQAAFGALAISPYADFDEDSFEWGQPFVRVDPGAIQQMQVNANLGWINEFGNYMENQMIVSTGINHMDVAQTGQETATKSLQRRESQMLIVEAGMKYNVATGFTRLALLLKDLIRLHYKTYPINSTETKNRKIRVEGAKFVRNKKNDEVSYEKKEGYSYFDLLPKDLEEDLDLVLELGNIAMSKSIEMDLQLQGVQQVLQLPPQMTPEGQQKPVYKVDEVAKFLQDKFNLPKEMIDNEDTFDQDLLAKAKEGLLYKQDDPETFIKNQEAQAMQAGAGPMGGLVSPGAIPGGNGTVQGPVNTP